MQISGRGREITARHVGQRKTAEAADDFSTGLQNKPRLRRGKERPGCRDAYFGERGCLPTLEECSALLRAGNPMRRVNLHAAVLHPQTADLCRPPAVCGSRTFDGTVSRRQLPLMHAMAGFRCAHAGCRRPIACALALLLARSMSSGDRCLNARPVRGPPPPTERFRAGRSAAQRCTRVCARAAAEMGSAARAKKTAGKHLRRGSPQRPLSSSGAERLLRLRHVRRGPLPFGQDVRPLVSLSAACLLPLDAFRRVTWLERAIQAAHK